MRVLRILIIVLTVYIFAATTLLFRIAVPAAGKSMSPVFSVPCFSIALLIIIALVYARKSSLGAGWIIGSIMIPLIVPFIMVLLHKPDSYSSSTGTKAGRLTDAYTENSFTKKPQHSNTALSVAPKCVWTPGTGSSAAPGDNWDEVSGNFIAGELKKEVPDFPALRTALSRFPEPEQHGAWHRIAWEFKNYGDTGAANFAFTEALLADPDPSSTSWSNMDLYGEVLGAAGLSAALASFPCAFSIASREKAEKLVRSLAEKMGLFRSPAPPSRRAYNKAVSLFLGGSFAEAREILLSITEDYELGSPSLYFAGLCSARLGEPFEFPGDDADDAAAKAGNAYLALGIASDLIARGGKAAYPKENTTIMIRALYKQTRYTISVATLMGSFMLMGWKNSEGKDIPLNDSTNNPNPSAADKEVIRMLKDAPGRPPAAVPEEGIPDTL